jgi:hypothetical protein
MKNETTGLMTQRLKPYTDFVSSLFQQMKSMSAQYNKIRSSPNVPGERITIDGWKFIGRGDNASLQYLEKNTPTALLEMTLTPRGVIVYVHDRPRKHPDNLPYGAAYSLRYTVAGNVKLFKMEKGNQSSDFLRRSWEAARQLGFTKAP